jgi:hypothetical protein
MTKLRQRTCGGLQIIKIYIQNEKKKLNEERGRAQGCKK